MAERRIQDFATAVNALDDDLLLIASDGETFNIKVKTLIDAVWNDAEKQAMLSLLKVLSENCGTDAVAPYNALAKVWGGELLPEISPYTAQLGKATLSKIKLGRS